MEEQYHLKIAQELNLRPNNVEATIKLLDDGSTIPFISRYRKEATGALDEVAVTSIRDRVIQLRELDKRKAFVIQSIHEQKKLTEELKKKILQAPTMTILEDIYLPYKPKKRTKATVAKEKGLEPLAQLIFAQKGCDPAEEAKKYIDEKKKVKTIEEALEGSRHIIAEWINENANLRSLLRSYYRQQGVFRSKVIKGKEAEGQKYKDYFQWEEPALRAPSHRILAARRAEQEKIVTLRIIVPEEEAVAIIKKEFVKGKGGDSLQVADASIDSFKRLLSLSLEAEYRMELKKKADSDAIEIFAKNLRPLLMESPVGQKKVMAIDPGYRTGCKVVCLDAQGQLLCNDTIYLIDSQDKKKQSAETIVSLCRKYAIEIIAVGNGTASQETEQFIRSLNIKDVPVVLVSESGASVYSASKVARDEFSDYDVTVRGAVSIGRRLMDPLAELVKIDPKSIGVGQYQHDVDQKLLKISLDDVVMSCVNQVGVEVNTASKQLLTYVSGLGEKRAQLIIDHRNKYGPFLSRETVKLIDGFGDKAFQQSAGFLRIVDGKNPLDASAVHPESYSIVEQMAKDVGCDINTLMAEDRLRKKIDLKKYVCNEIGMPTLLDIKEELAKPGRDPREPFELFSFKEGISSIGDLEPGMKLDGVVTNITAFGAFVDIGVHQDGLVHISQLSDKFVKNPSDVIHLHQKIKVIVLEIDKERNRIALSAKESEVNR